MNAIEALKQEPGLVWVGLALIISLIGDVADYYGGFLPIIGEPVDLIIPPILALVLRSPWPLIAMGEAVSGIAPPMALLDFMPSNTALLFFTLIRKVEKVEGKSLF